MHIQKTANNMFYIITILCEVHSDFDWHPRRNGKKITNRGTLKDKDETKTKTKNPNGKIRKILHLHAKVQGSRLEET